MPRRPWLEDPGLRRLEEAEARRVRQEVQDALGRWHRAQRRAPAPRASTPGEVRTPLARS